jgi:phosphodiesterase/alkaline phosphatase D-like protein
MRRTLHIGALALTVLTSLLFPTLKASAVTFTHGVASGEVTQNSVVLWTRVDRKAMLTVEVSTDPDFAGRTLLGLAKASAAKDFTAKARIKHLEPATQYFYRWWHNASLSEVGTFITAPLPIASTDIRFAWSGDSDPSRIGSLPIFNNWETLDAVRLEQPDFFVYLGDTIYSDSRAGGLLPDVRTLTEYRDLYKAGRDFSALRDLTRATSLYAMWDDHEVRDNWDGETVDRNFLKIGRKTFLEYMPLVDQQAPRGSDCATAPLFRTFRWGREADVIIVDTRSCRSASAEAFCLGDPAPTMPSFLRIWFGLPAKVAPGCLDAIQDPSRTMLGKRQKKRLKATLLASSARFKVIITPQNIQQVWIAPYDNWEGYAAERAEILNFIREHDIRNVVFLTTDGHQSIMKPVFIDRFTDPEPIAYEVMTGPIATTTAQNYILEVVGPKGIAAAQMVHDLLGAECRHLDAYSYGVVEVDAATGTAMIVLKDATGEVLHDQRNPAIPCVKTLGP